MSLGESSITAHGRSSGQELGRRTGYGYKHTPAIGPSSPEDTNDPNSVLGDGYGSDSDISVFEDDFVHAGLVRSSTASKAYTEQEEQEVVRVLDRRLVLFLAFLYLLSFLDRSNIGNARVAGLEESLSMTSAQFDMCLVGFYITYIAFEWMILLYRLVPPHIYISGCVLAWGLVASLQSVVTSFKQLLALRALLGVTEAAFGPGVPFYMTFFYRRSELAYRVGLQISAAPLATSIASSLAWVIVQAARHIGLEQWRALFLVEGFPSVIAAVVAWYWTPDSPAAAVWLSPRQRKVATLRLQSETTTDNARLSVRSGGSEAGSKIDLTDLWSTLRDPKAYLNALMFLSVNVSFASLPVFLPTVINSMSFSPLTSQILSAPPYLVAFIFVLVIGHYSDKIPDSRSLFLSGAAFLSCASYSTIAIAGHFHDSLGERASRAVRYIAVYPAAVGLFSSVVLIITWTLNNQQSTTGKGMGMVILNLVGQCGPLIGVRLFPRSSEPLYIGGMSVCAGFMGGVAVLALILRRYLGWLNARDNDVGKGSYEMVGLPGATTDREGTNMRDQDDDEEGIQMNKPGGLAIRTDGFFRFML